MASTMANIKIEGLCRTCMSEDFNLTSIYDYPSREDYAECAIRIAELLVTTIPQLTAMQGSDALPKGICTECVNKLLCFHDFQEMCLQSEKSMQMLRTPTDAQNKVLDLPENIVEVCMTEEDPLQSAEVENAKENLPDATTRKSADGQEKEPLAEQNDSGLVIKAENDLPSQREDNKDLDECSASLDVSTGAPMTKPRRFNCRICGKGFKRLYGLNRHEKVDHDRLPKFKDIGCRVCDVKFSSASSARRHERKMHNLDSPLKRPDNRPRRHKCEFCEKAYIDKPALIAHIRTHTGETPYLCPECGKAFNLSGNLNQHMKRHSSEKVFECSECPSKFIIAGDLTKHKEVHNKEKSCVCEICGKGFKTRDSLRRHKRYHSEIKRYKCDYCDKRFTYSDPMRRHMRTHTGEKPYKCKYCECPFSQSGDLMKHLRLHLGDKIYECELCPQSFRLLCEMREHFALHKTDDEETREQYLKEKAEKEVQIKALRRSKYNILIA